MDMPGHRVPNAELAAFSQQFATMLAADVKLMPAIVTSRQQTTDELLSEVLLEVQTGLENGLTLAASMSAHPDVFSPFCIQLVRQGELEGALPDAFLKLAAHYAGTAGAETGGAGGRVVVALDAGAISEAIRPFAVAALIAVGVVGIACGVILVAKERGLIPEGLSGPTILLASALTLLLTAVTLHGSRRRPAPTPVAAPARAAARPVAPTTAAPETAAPAPARTDTEYLQRDPSEPINLDDI